MGNDSKRRKKQRGLGWRRGVNWVKSQKGTRGIRRENWKYRKKGMLRLGFQHFECFFLTLVYFFPRFFSHLPPLFLPFLSYPLLGLFSFVLQPFSPKSVTLGCASTNKWRQGGSSRSKRPRLFDNSVSTRISGLEIASSVPTYSSSRLFFRLYFTFSLCFFPLNRFGTKQWLLWRTR